MTVLHLTPVSTICIYFTSYFSIEFDLVCGKLHTLDFNVASIRQSLRLTKHWGGRCWFRSKFRLLAQLDCCACTCTDLLYTCYFVCDTYEIHTCTSTTQIVEINFYFCIFNITYSFKLKQLTPQSETWLIPWNSSKWVFLQYFIIDLKVSVSCF